MERRRAGSPVYARQASPGSSSPRVSPANHRAYSAAGGVSSVKRAQNVAARAAAARLAQVMASQTAAGNDDDYEEDSAHVRGAARSHVGDFRVSSNAAAAAAGVASGRAARSPSPALGRNFMEPSVRSTSAGRPSISVREPALVPASRTSLRVPFPIPAFVPPIDRDKRFVADVGLGYMNMKGAGNQREASALQDELDMLQEENENILDKLRLAEERCTEAETRVRELEKQVATLGEGVSLEARLLSRKEASLRQREDALKAAKQTGEGRDEEIAAFRQELESAKHETVNTVEQLQEAESEVKALQSMTQRMILTEEEMEEVVLKRCWLARYWGLAVQHGICPEIAGSKHEHWSSLAPLPFEIVFSAGQKAKEEGNDDPERKNKLVRDLSDISGEGNIESMLSVEMGLRELSSLKVEDAIVLALAHHRRPNLVQHSISELNQQESEDILFKQGWLTYFWRRAKSHGVEEGIAEEKLKVLFAQSGKIPTSHDAVDVERGLLEMRKLGIEKQLWEASRREINHGSSVTIEKPNSGLGASF